MRTRTEVANELVALDRALGEFDPGDELFGVELMNRSLLDRRDVLVQEAADVSASETFA